MNDQPNNPTHGVTLEMMLTLLVDVYGWEELGRLIRVRCFNHDPSFKSSLQFLRKTPWARDKTERLYVYAKRQKDKADRKLLLEVDPVQE